MRRTVKTSTSRPALLVVLIGALLAFAEGYSNLACASTPSIIITVAGSFGAGAALSALIAQRRAGVSSPPPA